MMSNGFVVTKPLPGTDYAITVHPEFREDTHYGISDEALACLVRDSFRRLTGVGHIYSKVVHRPFDCAPGVDQDGGQRSLSMVTTGTKLSDW